MSITNLLLTIAFLGTPLLSLIWLLVSLVGYCVVRGQNKATPDRHPPQRLKSWKSSLIAAALLTGISLGMLAALAALVFSVVKGV